MDSDGPLNALKLCEQELRKFAAEAAGKGDYDMLARLGSAARAISEIAREWQLGADSQESSAIAATASVDERSEPPVSAKVTARSRPERSISRGYPRFIRRGDDLVKVGWSRADRREYQHRAAHRVLTALCQGLLEATKRRQLFTMEMLDRHLASGTNAVPGYQGYVWLAWLRSADLVKQHGRQGYSLVKSASFGRDVELAFAAVPAEEP